MKNGTAEIVTAVPAMFSAMIDPRASLKGCSERVLGYDERISTLQ